MSTSDPETPPDEVENQENDQPAKREAPHRARSRARQLIDETEWTRIPASADPQSRDYRDEAAAKLYSDAKVFKLVDTNAKLMTALSLQAEKLVLFPNTPFTKQNVRSMMATFEAIDLSQTLLERWHDLIYPSAKGPKA